MNFEKVITERYSVRKFENRHLKQEVIDKILKIGHSAPTGCNLQPYRVLVLNTDEATKKLKKCTKCHFDAPCAMLVCYSKNETWVRKYDGAISSPIDASIVTTHLMLAAQSMGIGTCWVMHFDPASMKNEFNIPEGIEPHALLVMGYPHKESKPLEMHFQSRPIEDVVFYDSF